MLGPNSHILLVEDSPVMANQTTSVLHSLGFKNITDARNGFAALQRLVESRELKAQFDLFVVDWEMPKLSGLEFYRMVKTMPEWASVPTIFLTSFNSVDYVITAATAGVEHYIIKPATKELLEKKLEAISKKDLKNNISDLIHSAPQTKTGK